jgi:L-fuculose-phosphate aldolase
MHGDFVRYGRLLFEQGLNNSHSGNMSRREGRSIYITRHGARLGDLSPRDIVKVNLGDSRKDKEASFEVQVHRAVYRACPSVNAIVHAHTPYGIVLSLKEKSVRPIDAEGKFYLPVIPVLSCKEAIASSEVASRLPALLKNHPAAIVKGHGAFAAGTTLEQATLYASVLESICRIIYLSKQL